MAFTITGSLPSSILGTGNVGGVNGTQAPGATVSLPAQPVTTPTNTPSDTSGSPGGTTTTTSTTPTVATLSPAMIQAALTAIANTVATNQNAYNSSAATNAANDQQQQLDEQTQEQNNTSSRSTAIQNAEQAAAQGNQGLKAVLASLGALGGTGQLLAGRAVADSANGDIGTANNTYTTNNQAIQKAIADYQTQVNARNAALTDSLNTDNRAAQTSGYQNIINEAENIGDTATVSKYLPQLVGATAPATAITPQAVLYNGANVGAYSPTNSVNVTAAPSQAAPTSNVLTQSQTTPVNSALYVNKTGSTPA